MSEEILKSIEELETKMILTDDIIIGHINGIVKVIGQFFDRYFKHPYNEQWKAKLDGKIKKEDKLKDYVEFIRTQYSELTKQEEVCKKEDCLKIREMLCHILYFADSSDKKPPEDKKEFKVVCAKCGHDRVTNKPKSEHLWSHLTDVSHCDICGEFAHHVGYKSECKGGN